MQSYGGQSSTGGTSMSQQEFLSRVSHVREQIRSLTGDVQNIAVLHQRALGGNDPGAESQLEALVQATQLKNTSIRDGIKALQADVGRTQDGSRAMKSRQFDTLNNEFKKELQGYLQEEQAYRDRYRDQIARQYRIVNPDASEDEVQRAADADWGNEGVFQQAVSSTNSLRSPICVMLTRSHSSGPTALAKLMPSWVPCARATTSFSASSRASRNW
jgi:syntaxin 1B/2/3